MKKKKLSRKAHSSKSHGVVHHHTHPLHRHVDHTVAYLVLGVVVVLFVLWVMQ